MGKRGVIVGRGAAGMSAAAKARRMDPSPEIVVFERSGYVSYGACGLPYAIKGEIARVAVALCGPLRSPVCEH
jgi:CoA-dependent NAD(P)H sulfur oxidoreductase